MKRSYVINSEISEKQIEADVANFLGWCSPETEHFRLLDVNEQLTGADKRFESVIPIYIQFKKSTGLKPVGNRNIIYRKNSCRLQYIRQFRKSQCLDDSPSLFFQLRDKSKTSTDFQHNILLSYSNPPLSYSIYVAPLLLSKKEYEDALFYSASRYLSYPFFERNIQINSTKWPIFYGTIPFLRAHISIVPHEMVTSHKHYYAYSKHGDDISWHSPKIINRERSLLSDFMVNVFKQIGHEETRKYNKLNLLKLINKNLQYIGKDPDSILNGYDDIDAIQNHGRWIRDEYGIRQLLLMFNKQ